MVQLLTTKSRNCQLVSWLGLGLRWEPENSHLVSRPRLGGGVVTGRRVSFTALIKIICSASEL